MRAHKPFKIKKDKKVEPETVLVSTCADDYKMLAPIYKDKYDDMDISLDKIGVETAALDALCLRYFKVFLTSFSFYNILTKTMCFLGIKVV